MMGAEGRSIAEVGWVGQCARGQRGGALWKQIARLENVGSAGIAIEAHGHQRRLMLLQQRQQVR